MANNKGVKSKRSPGTVFSAKGVNQGKVIIDPNSGLPVSVIEDSAGNKRLAVDANLTAQDLQIAVDLDFFEDGVHIGDRASGYELTIESDGSINANVEVDSQDGDNIAISSHPTSDQIFDEDFHSITTSNFEEIYSLVSTNNDTRLIFVECTMETTGVFRLKIDGVVKRELRNSPMDRNVIFEFKEHRPLLNGEELTIEAQVERFITNKAPYRTFTALEGYLV